jgi:uncharacterized protein YaaW (UPF0174 family)
MSAFRGKADMTKLPALKIFSGSVATALATAFGGWQGTGASYSRTQPGLGAVAVLSDKITVKRNRANPLV